MASSGNLFSFRFVVAIAASVACCAEATEIVIRRHATIEDMPFVRLADVAVIDATDSNDAVQIGNIVLGPAPARRGTITADQVRDRLVRSKLMSVDTVILGASHCEVSRNVALDADEQSARPTFLSRRDRDDARDRLEEIVLQRLASAFPGDGPFRVSIELNDVTVRMVLESKDPILIRGGTADLSQPQAMEVIGHQTGRFIATISRPSVVAVAAVPLSPGVIVQAHHLSFEPRDEPGLSDPQLLIGKKLTRSIPAGRTVQIRDLRKVIHVRNNTVVKVWVRGPGFAVHRLMKSRGEGGIGDVVAFVSLDGEQQVSATVTGPSDAEIPSTATAPDRSFEPERLSRNGQNLRGEPLVESARRIQPVGVAR